MLNDDSTPAIIFDLSTYFRWARRNNSPRQEISREKKKKKYIEKFENYAFLRKNIDLYLTFFS